jgi:hypothetical protein
VHTLSHVIAFTKELPDEGNTVCMITLPLLWWRVAHGRREEPTLELKEPLKTRRSVRASWRDIRVGGHDREVGLRDGVSEQDEWVS